MNKELINLAVDPSAIYAFLEANAVDGKVDLAIAREAVAKTLQAAQDAMNEATKTTLNKAAEVLSKKKEKYEADVIARLQKVSDAERERLLRNNPDYPEIWRKHQQR